MKRSGLILLFVIPFICLYAQPQQGEGHRKGHFERHEWRKQMCEQRKAYLEKEMHLTAAEREAFFAIYDEYEQKIHQSHQIERRTRKSLNDESTEADYGEAMRIIADQKKNRADIEQQFYQQLQKTLSAQKIYQFYQAEMNFKNLLIKDMPKHGMKKAE